MRGTAIDLLERDEQLQRLGKAFALAREVNFLLPRGGAHPSMRVVGGEHNTRA